MRRIAGSPSRRVVSMPAALVAERVTVLINNASISSKTSSV
jgi:hypothetical protein